MNIRNDWPRCPSLCSSWRSLDSWRSSTRLPAGFLAVAPAWVVRVASHVFKTDYHVDEQLAPPQAWAEAFSRPPSADGKSFPAVLARPLRLRSAGQLGRAGPGTAGVSRKAMTGVAIVIPMLNEAGGTAASIALACPGSIRRPGRRCWAVDGGSNRTPPSLSRRAAGPACRPALDPWAGRRAINRGVQEATAPIICVLHADHPAARRRGCRDAQSARGSLGPAPGPASSPLLSGPDSGPFGGTSFHNWIKTWYAPIAVPAATLPGAAWRLFNSATTAMFFPPRRFSGLSAAATPRCWLWRRRICASASTRLGRTRLVKTAW